MNRADNDGTTLQHNLSTYIPILLRKVYCRAIETDIRFIDINDSKLVPQLMKKITLRSRVRYHRYVKLYQLKLVSLGQLAP